MNWNLIWIVLFLPLVGSIIQAMVGGRVAKANPASGKRLLGAIAVLSVAIPFAVGVYITSQLAANGGESVVTTAFDWISLKSLSIPFEVRIDALSMTMVLIITGIGALIHLYATGYMSEEREYSRFFTYLNLFVAAMLCLVLGNNLAMMFIGWEGVGLCSYLLIGFWYKDVNNAKAANKAFIVNRIGDWGFTLGIFLLAGAMLQNPQLVTDPTETRLLSFDVISLNAVQVLQSQPGLATAIAICFFIGAMGKSAQFPLYFWLPDAMAGPTPVSALIHAATMVTAGVFMVNRLHYLFELSPVAMAVVAGIGAFTALFAALIAFGQSDIKKILAYSTVSQLGFMFIACGVGAFWVGMFHVITHAFFKALLFLGSGAVIHAMAHDQDVRHYGNLAKYIKITSVTMIVGWLAIAGFPYLSGFYSKEQILGNALGNHVAIWGGVNVGVIAGWVALGVALLTAGYMTRLTMLTFFGGKEQWRLLPADTGHHDHEEHHSAHGHSEGHDHGPDEHGFFYADGEEPHEEHEHHHALEPGHEPKEVPPSMWIPLVVLAVLSVFGGFALENHHLLQKWLYPNGLTFLGGHEVAGHPEGWVGKYLLYMGIGAGLAGMAWGIIYYRRGLPKDERGEETWKPWRRSAGNQFGYDAAVMDAGVGGGGLLAKIAWWFDACVIDGFVNGVAGLSAGVGRALKVFQTGYARTYALMMLIGSFALVAYFAWLAAKMGGKL